MGRLLTSAAVVLVLVLVACQSAPTFEGRVSSAKAMEEQKGVREYVERHLFPVMGTDMSSAMQRCLAFPDASKADFTIVADIAADGSIRNVAVRPETNTARCFSKSFGTLRLSPLPEMYRSGLPIFIEMGLGG